MFHLKSLLVPLLLLISFDVFAQSSSGGGGGSSGGSSSGSGHEFFQRAERRESKRWTLQEWLEQRDRTRMMDIWLSMNSPSPYELMLGGSYNSFQTDTGGGTTPTKYTSYKGEFSAYAQIVGLSVEYENNTQESFNDLSGLFNLRLLGNSIQGSYFTIHYGTRARTMTTPNVRLNQQFGQASIQLYATKNFGFDGRYRYYLPTTDTTLGDVNSTLTEAGAFIDFKNFRVFGTWFKEAETDHTSSADTSTTRTGIRSGLKIFF